MTAAPSRRRPLLAGPASLALLAALLAAGCLSRPSLVRERYGLLVPPPGTPPPEATKVLALPSVEVPAAFDRIGFVYRTGETRYETDPYTQWLSAPREQLAEALRANLRTTGLFRDVGRVSRGADLVARVTVTEVYGDFRRPDAPAARVALEVTIAGRAEPGRPAEAPLTRAYALSLPIPARTPEAVAEGIGRAVAQAASEIAIDVRRAGLAP